MDILQLVSIFLEAVVVVVCLVIAVKKKQFFGFGLATTFGIYVFYDLARLQGWGIGEGILRLLFFIATVSALLAVLKLYWR